jgi:hypothetical protein
MHASQQVTVVSNKANTKIIFDFIVFSFLRFY